MLETHGFPSLSHGRFGFFLMLLLAGKIGLRLSFRRCELRYVSLELRNNRWEWAFPVEICWGMTLASRKHLYFQKSYTAFYINCQDYYTNATMCERPLQLILIYISDFPRLDTLDTMIIKCLATVAVVKACHKPWQIKTNCHKSFWGMKSKPFICSFFDYVHYKHTRLFFEQK